MKRANKEQSSRPRARAASLACAALALFAGVSAHAAAQQGSKPNIADEVEGKKVLPTEADPKLPATPGRKAPQPKPPRPPAPSYEVTFKTDIPEAEIFIVAGNSSSSAQSLGKTDADGRLTKRLPRGTYNLLASRPGYRIQRQRVEVRSRGPNDVNFNLAMPAVAKKAEAEAAPEPTPTPAETPEPEPTDPLADADALIKRFLDVKETEAVKAEEWRAMRERTNAASKKTRPTRSSRRACSPPTGSSPTSPATSPTRSWPSSRRRSPSPTSRWRTTASATPTSPPTSRPRRSRLTLRPSTSIRSWRSPTADGDALTKQNKTKEAAVFYNRAKSFGQQLPADTGLALARELKKRKRWAQALKEFQDVAATKPSIRGLRRDRRLLRRARTALERLAVLPQGD